MDQRILEFIGDLRRAELRISPSEALDALAGSLNQPDARARDAVVDIVDNNYLLSGLARNFGDVFELWSGGQCGVGAVVGGDALE